MPRFFTFAKAALAGLAACIFALSAASLQAAGEPPLKEILDGLKKNYQNVSSIQAFYSRTTVTTNLDRVTKVSSTQTATGQLFWLDPANLSLEQQTPEPERLITDGKTVWWYIPSENLVHVYRDTNLGGEMKPLLNFLAGLSDLDQDFIVTLDKTNQNRGGQYKLDLKRRNEIDGGTNRFSVWCGPNFELSGFQLVSPTGDVTDFYLAQIILNPPLKPALFNFKIPPKATVLEEE